MVNGYVRPETRTCTDFAVFTYEATGTDNHVIAQFNAGLNHRVSANRYVVTQLRRRVDHRTGCNVLRGLRRGIQNLRHARVSQVGILHYQRGTFRERKIVWVMTTADAGTSLNAHGILG